MTRSKKAAMNTVSSLLFEIVSAVCGFVLPHLILSHFGSAYNGITSSIAQFISCVALLKSGIGSVTRASLYKPLALKDDYAISGIFVATENFMKKIAVIFSVGLLLFAVIYPFFFLNEFQWSFSFTLVLIIGVSTFAQYYFGMANQMLLEADQRQYISTLINIVGTVLNTIIAAILISTGCSIHVVKLGSSCVFVLQPVVLMIYVGKKYKINRRIEPNTTALSQRWDAFGHQLASFINTNTDIIILTIATNTCEVSVYSIYCMIARTLQKAINAFTSGFSAAFGNMLAKNENKKLYEYFRMFDFVVFMLSLWAFSCAALLIVPFVRIYTKTVTDADYIRPVFACLLAFAEFLICIKIPYQTLIQTYGHFKQTKNGALIEAALNIVTSVGLVFIIGLEGVLIGTIIAAMYRVIDYGIYTYRNLLKIPLIYYIKKCFLIVIVSSICCYLINKVLVMDVINYFKWIVLAGIVALVDFFIIIICSVIFYKNEMKNLTSFVYYRFIKKNKK